MDQSDTTAEKTYDQLAGVYDALTAGYDHGPWLRQLHALASGHGNGRRRLLDVGCGTGASFLPLLGDGFDVFGCDLSGGMTAIADQRSRGRARVFCADMRALPDVGHFDVVTCLDDAVNHLLDRRGLVAAFRSMARALAPSGVLIFDANTLGMYRTDYAGDVRFESAGHKFKWRGRCSPDVEAGVLGHLEIDARTPDGDVVHVLHKSRHYPLDVIHECLAAAGLRAATVLGQTLGAVLHRDADELAHRKALVVAVHDV